MITYTEALGSTSAADLEGLLAHWDFAPPPGTLLAMLQGSSAIVLARDDESSVICGYVAALTDGVVCAYISALEVRMSYRQRGIGSKLLELMTDRLDVQGIYLCCAPAMIPFYESTGFKPVAGMAKRKALSPPRGRT